MRRFETPYIADWFATTLRWMVLVGLIVSLSISGQLKAVPFGPLILMFLWNITMSIMAGMSMRVRVNHRQIVLGIDFLLALFFFWAQGGLEGSLAWIGLVPILTGAVYIEMRGHSLLHWYLHSFNM